METQKRKPGRPVGAASKMAREAREAAQATGLLPHEILLSIARREPQVKRLIDGVTGKETSREYEVPDLEMARTAAQAAAPYYAPKISTVEVISGVSDADLDAIIAGAAAQAGIGISLGGEGEEDEDQDGAGDPRQGRTGKRRIRHD